MSARRAGWGVVLAVIVLASCRTSNEGAPYGPAAERPADAAADVAPVIPVDAGGGAGPDAQAPDAGGGRIDASPLDPGALIGHWKLDEQGAMVAADSSGKNNPAALVDLPITAWAAGRLGGAIELPGGQSHLRVASSVSLNGIFRAVTVAAWVLRPSGPSAAGERAVVISRQGAYALGFEGDSARWAITVDARPTPAVLLGLEPAGRGRWIHVAGTFDGSQSRLFVDGREVAAVAFSGTIGSSMVPLTLGARLATVTADEALAGRLDDVRLYARALSPAEVAALAAP